MKLDLFLLATLWFCFLLLIATPARGQWSNDPFNNLAICALPGEQILPKIAATSDGGCYITWFDARNGNYALYMQRLNVLGEPQWISNGLLISDHPQQSWLTDYDLAVDAQDNAVVVFSDIRHGGNSDLDVVVYKIAPDGTFLWGTDGVSLSDTTTSDFEPSPMLAITSTGNVLVAWTKSGTTDRVALQMLSASGQKMWGENGITITGASGEKLSSPLPVAAEGDSVIVVWKNSTGPFWAPVTRLYAQKFDATGNGVWGTEGVLFYDQGAISPWNVPRVYPDDANGALITYYDSPSATQFRVWVQHIAGDGTLLFPMNGIQATLDVSRLHMYPTLALAPSSAMFLFWVETNTDQNQFGLYGQKLSAAGTRLWGDNGRQFFPLSFQQISQLDCGMAGEQVMVNYFRNSSGSVNIVVEAFAIDSLGNYTVSPTTLSEASLGEKLHLEMAINNQLQLLSVWGDRRNDMGDIYAQNLNLDGTLGNPPPSITITEPADSTVIMELPLLIHYATTGVILDSSHNVRVQVQVNDSTLMQTLENPIQLDTLWDYNNLIVLRLVDTTGAPLDPLAADSVVIFYQPTGIKKNQKAMSNSIDLVGNYPNPFNASTTFVFILPRPQRVSLKIYNVRGQEIATLVSSWQGAGEHHVRWEANHLASGVYFYRFATSRFTATRKLILLR